MDYPIVPLSPMQFRRRVERIVDIYLQAMGYDPEVKERRVSHWTSLSRTPGFKCYGAFDASQTNAPAIPTFSVPDRGTLVGFVYGVPGNRQQWWNFQVRSAMAISGIPAPVSASILDDYVELSELHVAPEYQGHGIGEALLKKFASNLPHSKVLLSTPEIADEDNRAFRLYRRVGFIDVLRRMHFPGDPRPFAILGLPLPLTDEARSERAPELSNLTTKPSS